MQNSLSGKREQPAIEVGGGGGVVWWWWVWGFFCRVFFCGFFVVFFFPSTRLFKSLSLL